MSIFVSYKMAMKLKEKGFREKCMWHYYDDTKDIYKSSSPQCYNYGGNTSDAPTISQVLKWLRDEKGIHITICVCGDGWFYEVINISSGKSLVEDYEDDMIQSYEEAAIAGIEYVLNNLI